MLRSDERDAEVRTAYELHEHSLNPSNVSLKVCGSAVHLFLLHVIWNYLCHSVTKGERHALVLRC